MVLAPAAALTPGTIVKVLGCSAGYNQYGWVAADGTPVLIDVIVPLPKPVRVSSADAYSPGIWGVT